MIHLVPFSGKKLRFKYEIVYSKNIDILTHTMTTYLTILSILASAHRYAIPIPNCKVESNQSFSIKLHCSMITK